MRRFSRSCDRVARMGRANAVTPTSPGFMRSGHSWAMARIRVKTSHTNLELAVSTGFRRSIWRNRQQWACRLNLAEVVRTPISRLGHGHAELRKAPKTGACRRRNQQGLVHGQKSRACRCFIRSWFIVQVSKSHACVRIWHESLPSPIMANARWSKRQWAATRH